MAYSNSEQIFMDVLGNRSPSPSEQKEIDALLAIVQRAGFLIDDPSNAAHITLLAWGWAKQTTRNEVVAALHSHHQEVAASVASIQKSIEKSQQPQPAPVLNVERMVSALIQELKNNPQPAPVLDVATVASALQAHMPQQTVKLDLSILRDVLHESISKIWLVVIGIGLAISFWGGIAWQQHLAQPVIEQLQQQIQQTRQQNQQLIDKLSAHHAH